MKNIVLSVTLIVLPILACAVPSVMTIDPTPSASPTATSVPSKHHMDVDIPVVGCWWLRETPGGKPIDTVCDTNIPVGEVLRTGWAKTPSGWICVWAFGVSRADGECELKETQ